MTPKFKTRDLEKSLYTNYLKRAEECHHTAKSPFEVQEWNAATISTNANRIAKILSIKTMTEYEERLVFKSEAEKVLKDCERFLDYVKGKLPK